MSLLYPTDIYSFQRLNFAGIVMETLKNEL